MKIPVICVAVLTALSVAATARAEVLLTLNQSRGGYSSVTTSPFYATLRSDTANQLPQYTFVDTPTLTPASLQGVHVFWTGVVVSSGNSLELTPAEQSALMSFVQSGGTAVLFADNLTWAGNAAAGNDSLTMPFGLHVTGTGAPSSFHNVISSNNYIMNGVFGPVGSTLTSDYPGWFDVVPSNAVVLSRLQANNEVTGVWLPAGSFGAGSGDVIVFADSGYRNIGGALSPNYDTMYLNILAHVPAPGSAVLLAIAAVPLRRRRSC